MTTEKQEYALAYYEIITEFETEFNEKVLKNKSISDRVTSHLGSADDYDSTCRPLEDIGEYFPDFSKDQITYVKNAESVEDFISRMELTMKDTEYDFDNEEGLLAEDINGFAYAYMADIQVKYVLKLRKLNEKYKDKLTVMPSDIPYRMYTDTYFYESSRCW